MDDLTAPDDPLFRCTLASLPWERWPNTVFGERGIGHSATSDRLSAWSSPSRGEGILSRLCLHTLRTSLAERSMHLRMLRGFTGGQNHHSGLGGLAPVLISIISPR